MTDIEENAYKAMVSIFEALAYEEKQRFDGHFAGDMIKVNKKSCVFPVFAGFSGSDITLVSLSRKLEKEDTLHIPLSQVKEISMKKRFLSRIYTLRIECMDSTSYILGVPHTLSYIPVQRENVDLFLTTHFLLKLNR
ncbi:hypothetical protein [Proteiniclasticum sp.]|uniref:hypothetical protein n=1 Tax=Proteiniclasticum sp. TaxID=2053595 RepID=UPI00289FFED6|nr:hypothetical protein [Proteiniclasticum sp.]